MPNRILGGIESRRHWFVTLSSIFCFATGLAFVFSQLYHPREVSFRGFEYWSYTWLWSVLPLLPQPASLSGVLLLFEPWRDLLRDHASIAFSVNVVFVLFSAVLGWALWTRRSWARWILAALCVFQIAAAVGNIAISGQQFTYCAEGTIYPCSKNLLARLLPYYGFSLAGITVSLSALAFLWRYGLNPAATGDTTGIASAEKSEPRQADALVNVSRWIIVVVAVLIASDYSYFAVLWSPNLFRGGASLHVLPIRLVLSLILFAIASYATIIVRLVRRPDRFAFALAAGTSLACGLASFAGIGAEETLGLPFFLGLGPWLTLNPQHFVGAYALFSVSAATYLAIVTLAFVALWKLKWSRTSSPGTLGAGFVLPLVVAISWPQAQTKVKTYTTFSRLGKPTPQQQTANDRQTAALDLVRAFGHCAFQFRRTHPGQGFPATSSSMGPGGSGCLSASELAPQLDGFQVRYEAAPPDAQGSVYQFHLFVMKTLPATAYDLGYFLDGSGLITGLTHKSEPYDSPGNDLKQDPTPEDPLRRTGPLFSSAIYWLHNFQDCLNRIRDRNAAKQYPSTLEPLLDTVAAYGDPCISRYNRVISRCDLRSNRFTMTFNPVERWDENHAEARYAFQYFVRADPAGKRTGYALTAQPVAYNEDGVRSYYSDETQKLRWTSADRVATAEDAEALPCERTFMVPCLDVIPEFSGQQSRDSKPVCRPKE